MKRSDGHRASWAVPHQSVPNLDGLTVYSPDLPSFGQALILVPHTSQQPLPLTCAYW